MRILKIHKRIEVDKSIGNMRITSLHYSRPIENSSKWENYTECDDCGCLFDYDFRVPIWKCMLPRWIKNIIAKSALRRFEDV